MDAWKRMQHKTANAHPPRWTSEGAQFVRAGACAAIGAEELSEEAERLFLFRDDRQTAS